MKELYFVNSLEKVFPDEAPGGRLEKISMLRNERYSFQLAIFCEKEETEGIRLRRPRKML